MKYLKNISFWILANVGSAYLLVNTQAFDGPTWEFNIYLLYFWWSVASGTLAGVGSLVATTIETPPMESIEGLRAIYKKFHLTRKYSVPVWFDVLFDSATVVFLAATGHGWLTAFWLFHMATMASVRLAGRHIAEEATERSDTVVGPDTILTGIRK